MSADLLSEFCLANHDRIEAVVTALGSYQPQAVDTNRFQIWLRQLQPPHYEIGLRLIENVEFYAVARLHTVLRELHTELKVQLATDGFRDNKDLVFVPVGTTGESGQEILTRYRNVNRIHQTNASLAQVVELQQLLYTAASEGREMAVIFLDDFVGTGKKVTDFWTDVLSQNIVPTQAMYLGVAVACTQGVNNIQAQTPFRVVPVHMIQPRTSLLTSNRFTDAERESIIDYCRRVGNPPLGVGGLGLMLAFTHGCPNNVISLLRGSKRQRHWKGILPRFDDLP
jgi:uracil phosphoribosyltransferase